MVRDVENQDLPWLLVGMKGPALSVTLAAVPSFNALPIKSCRFLKPSLPGTSK